MLEKDAVNILSESEYGTHALIIYRNLNVLRYFYSRYIQKQIRDKNEVIQFLSFYETENSVRTVLSNGDLEIDIDNVETRDKTLIIHDSLDIYFGQTSPQSIRDDSLCLVEYANCMKTGGVSILGDMGAFFYKKQINYLLEYEKILSKGFDVNLKGICLYHQNDFDSLSDDFKQKLIDNHQITIKI